MKKMSLWKTILCSLAILVVGFAVIIGLAKFGFTQSWIALMFLICFALIKGLKLQNWLEVVVGGLVGITLGYGMSLLSLVLSLFVPFPEIIAQIVYLVIILLAIFFNLRGQIALLVNPTMWIFFVIFLSKDVSNLHSLLQYYGLFLGMAIITGLVLLVLQKTQILKEKSKADVKG